MISQQANLAADFGGLLFWGLVGIARRGRASFSRIARLVIPETSNVGSQMVRRSSRSLPIGSRPRTPRPCFVRFLHSGTKTSETRLSLFNPASVSFILSLICREISARIGISATDLRIGINRFDDSSDAPCVCRHTRNIPGSFIVVSVRKTFCSV